MSYIEVKNLTKDYGDDKGIFNVSFSVDKGEMFGFIGTNGAGKTTTIRHLLGFSKPDSGTCSIDGLDSWKSSPEIMKHIGYVPGEIAFPDLKSGTEVIKSQAELLNLKRLDYANELIKKLQLDVRGNPRTMSKGMKQKLAIVLALMHNPEIIILDEPTTGLDPLMRDTFMEIIKEQHKKGKTIIISSHMFEELEPFCDKVAFIMNGRILDIADMHEIRNSKWKYYKIEFLKEQEYEKFLKLNYKIVRNQKKYQQVTVKIEEDKITDLLKDLTKYELKFMNEVKYNLEKYFNEVIEKGEKEND